MLMAFGVKHTVLAVIVSAAAIVLSSGEAAKEPDTVPDCDILYNIGFLLYADVMRNHQDAIDRCLGYSNFANAILDGRPPNREELTKFFKSDDCRQVTNLMLAKVKENGDKCTLGAYKIELGQLASLSFDDLVAVYAPFLGPSTEDARLV
ncbi:hypothetical protein DYB32_009723 [Aphanomyces invadans]|uniref:Secreted protein n=1 Tax=Aphanomyces invadans TaxID=157072 RepID=A0A3R7CTR3_9STRA|nr:hypothetical protein DYB32_009723 [Aphanomyces invadans]